MLEINEQHLSLFQFKKVYIKGADGRAGIFYHKRGIYLKFLCDGYYKVYNKQMQFLGTINDLYRLQLLLIIKQYPLNMN
jgi:hypothetical protein